MFLSIHTYGYIWNSFTNNIKIVLLEQLVVLLEYHHLLLYPCTDSDLLVGLFSCLNSRWFPGGLILLHWMVPDGSATEYL